MITTEETTIMTTLSNTCSCTVENPFYLVSDEKSGPHILGWYDTREEASAAADERYNTLGKLCHVEDDHSSDVLYNPAQSHEE